MASHSSEKAKPLKKVHLGYSKSLPEFPEKNAFRKRMEALRRRRKALEACYWPKSEEKP